MPGKLPGPAVPAFTALFCLGFLDGRLMHLFVGGSSCGVGSSFIMPQSLEMRLPTTMSFLQSWMWKAFRSHFVGSLGHGIERRLCYKYGFLGQKRHHLIISPIPCTSLPRAWKAHVAHPGLRLWTCGTLWVGRWAQQLFVRWASSVPSSKMFQG